MTIQRFNQFPEGSGSLSNDDIFLFMDDPASGGITKKISLNELNNIIGGGSGGGPYSISNIIDFNSSVSGLLPTIANSGNNRVLTSTGSSFGINAESSLTFDGTNLSAPYLLATYSSGNEGGEIQLAKPPSGTLSGGITIDAYQNKLRFFEQGGDARGFYLDLSSAGIGVSTNLAINIVAGSGISVTASSGSFTINSKLVSDPSGITGATSITNIVQISQTNYDNLPSYDPNTIYIINT